MPNLINKYLYMISGIKIYALANNRQSAWMLIRNKCKEIGIAVPTINLIQKL